MTKTPFVAVALLALAATGCPDSSKSAPAMEAKAEEKAAEIVTDGLANEPAEADEAEPAGDAHDDEAGDAHDAEPVSADE